MNRTTVAELRFDLEPGNPGQFFACCGLFELAHRVYGDVETRFESSAFVIEVNAEGAVAPSSEALLSSIVDAKLEALEPDDETASPLLLGAPFQIRLDWWRNDRDLKVWAGSMRSLRIASAMKASVRPADCSTVLDRATIVYDPVETAKKVEPFYFDARRGASAQAVDVGFSADALQMTTAAYPAVEFLCLVGLQRFRPRRTRTRRVFDYATWSKSINIQIGPAAVSGLLPHTVGDFYRFENAFRTDQRKHKAFTPARRIQ